MTYSRGEARAGGRGVSRTSGFQLQTIGTAPHAVVGGPGPFPGGTSPARPWLPASAPGHAPGALVLGEDWPRAQGGRGEGEGAAGAGGVRGVGALGRLWARAQHGGDP